MKHSIIKYTICTVILCILSFSIHLGTTKTLLLFLFLALAAGIALFQSKQATKRPVPKEQTEQKQLPELDILRILAAVLVISLHSFQAGYSDNPRVSETAFVVCCCIFLTCNYLFVMLAGALAFKWKEQNPVLYYIDRVIRICIPMFFYYFWNYYWYAAPSDILRPGFFKTVAHNLFSGQIELSPQFWLLYPIMAIYLIAPFIRYMMKEMPYKVLCLMSGIAVLFILFTTAYATPLTNELPFWIMVGLVGFWMIRPETRKTDLFILIAGIIGLAVLILIHPGSTDQGKGLMLLMSCGMISAVYLICKGVKFSKTARMILKQISRYTFGILLIHWWVLYFIVREMLHIDGSSFGGAGVLIAVIVTFGISFGIAYLFDNILIEPVTFLLKKLVDLVRKRVSR